MPAVAMSDDLYKAADQSSYWDEALAQYLNASDDKIYLIVSDEF
jgi:hypothetical protein